MKQFIQSLVTRPEKSVATITSNLAKTVEELEAHAAAQSEQWDAKADQIETLLREQAAHAKEDDQARKVAQNIKALLG